MIFRSVTLCRWLRLGIRARVEWAVELALKFVSEQGRMKFVRPIYRFVTSVPRRARFRSSYGTLRLFGTIKVPNAVTFDDT